MNDNNLINEIQQLRQEVEALKQARTRRLREFMKRAFSKTSVLVGVAIAAIVTGAIIYAAQNVFVDGTVISADAVNNNFTELYNAMPVRDTARGLVIKNNETNPTYQMDINADEIILQDTGGRSVRVTGVDLTVDITASGANGLDAGSEANSNWYHIWVIYDPSTSTRAGLFSTSATAPTMPTGYTYKAYTGAVYNKSNGNFPIIFQNDKKVIQEYTIYVTDGHNTTYTQINLSSVIPPTAKQVGGFLMIYGSSGDSMIDISSNSSGYASKSFYHATTGTMRSEYSMMITETQKIYYKMTSGWMYLWVTEWEY